MLTAMLTALTAFLPSWWKLAAGAIAGGVAVAGIAYTLGHWNGEVAGHDKYVAEQAAATARAELERKGDDAKLQSLSDYDLCVLALGDQRMPIDACEQLRGVQ